MRTLALLALLATSPAHAIMVQFTQTGVLEDAAGSVVTLTAFAHGDGVLSSTFGPDDRNPTFINPDFSLALLDIRLAVGETVYESAAGTYSQVGDLAGPGGYDAAWSFQFDGWTLGVLDGSISDAITSAAAAAWQFPEVQSLLVSDFNPRVYSLRDPNGIRTPFQFQSGDLLVTEVPEPSTLVLFASALLGLAFCTRRRQRKQRHAVAGA